MPQTQTPVFDPTKPFKVLSDGPQFDPSKPSTEVKPQAAPAAPDKPWYEDVAEGVAKGLGSTVTGLGELVHKIPGVSAAVDSLYGTPGLSKKSFEMAHAGLEATNTAQKIGFGAEQIGEFLLPFGNKPKVVGTAMKMGREALNMGARTAAQTGGDPESVLTASLLGAASPIAVSTAKAVGNAVTSKLPERLYNQVFKLAEDDWRLAIEAQAKGAKPNPTLAREVLERGLFGSDRNMAIYAVRKLDDLEDKVQKLVTTGAPSASAAGGTSLPTMVLPKKSDFVKLLGEVRQQFGKGFFSERAKEAAQLERSFRGIKGDEVRIADALKVKRFLDRMRNTSTFRLDPQLSAKQDELKGAADLVRSTLKKDPKFADLMNEERVMIEAMDSLVTDAVARQNKRLLSLTDVLIGGGSMAVTSPIGGVGAMAAVRGFQQPFTLTGLGQLLHRLGNVPPAGTAETGMRAATGAAVQGVR